MNVYTKDNYLLIQLLLLLLILLHRQMTEYRVYMAKFNLIKTTALRSRSRLYLLLQISDVMHKVEVVIRYTCVVVVVALCT